MPVRTEDSRGKGLRWPVVVAVVLVVVVLLAPGKSGVEIKAGKVSLGYYPLEWGWSTLTGDGVSSTIEIRYYGPIRVTRSWP